MRFVVHYRGSPLRECATLVQAYSWMHDEYTRRWPQSIWGYQEAAAHGLEVIGTPELDEHEARELRANLRRE